MSDQLNILLMYGELNSIVTVDSNTSIADLKTLAASTLGISAEVTLRYYDKEFGVWCKVNDGYQLKNKDRLEVVIFDDKGKIIKDPPADVTDGQGLGGSQVQQPPVQPPPVQPPPVQPPVQTIDGIVARWIGKIKSLMHGSPRAQGMAFLVGMSNAEGTDVDLRNMESAFVKLNFAIFREINLHANEIKALAQAIATFAEFPKQIYYKYIAFYYSGHGGISDSTGGSFLQAVPDSSETDRVYLKNDIVRVIEMGQKEKCLLFFIDCCMSNASDKGSPPIEEIRSTHTNCLVACSTSFGQEALGFPKTGGVWTRTLSQLLDEDKLLVAILAETKVKVSKECNQSCSINGSVHVNLKASVKPEEGSLLKKSPKMKDVVDLLDNYTAQWDEIGRLLDVDYSVRQVIDTDFSNSQKKLSAVVDQWIKKQTSDVTWQSFIDCMKKGQLMQLAGNIERFLEKDDVKEKYADDPEWIRTVKKA